MMTMKEKAKAYERAIARAKEQAIDGYLDAVAVNDIFPELKEDEQKPAWSEEDENHVKSILSTIECCKAQFPNAQAVVEAYNADINWLKSLRPQSLWKPSDEQIKVCKKVYADILSAKGFDLGTVNGELNRLEEELKKLKE